MNDLSFDICLYGTGLLECLLARYLTGCGYRVIHIEGHDSYGGEAYRSFNLQQLEAWATQEPQSSLFPDSAFTNRCTLQFSPSWVPEQFCNRKAYYLELMPCIFYSVSPIIEFLKESTASLYLEFAVHKSELTLGYDATSKPPDSDPLTLPPIHVTPNIAIEKPIQKQIPDETVGDKDTIIDSDKPILSQSPPLHQKKNHIENHSHVSLLKNQSSMHFVPVPLSKSSIFTHSALSLIDKRKLMKFLAYHIQFHQQSFGSLSKQEDADSHISSLFNHELQSLYLSLDASEDENWFKHLNKFQLSPCVLDILQYGYCLYEYKLSQAAPISTRFMMQRLLMLVSSLSYYAQDRAFIYPMYGISDVCQALVRSSGVLGATYMLNAQIQQVFYGQKNNNSENRLESNVSESSQTSAVHIELSSGLSVTASLIISSCSLPEVSNLTKKKNCIMNSNENNLLHPVSQCCRMIAICDGHVLTEKGFNLSVVLDLKQNESHPIHILQLDHTAGVVPSPFTVVYLYHVSNDCNLMNPEESACITFNGKGRPCKKLLDCLFKIIENKAKCHYAVSYQQQQYTNLEMAQQSFHSCAGILKTLLKKSGEEMTSSSDNHEVCLKQDNIHSRIAFLPDPGVTPAFAVVDDLSMCSKLISILSGNPVTPVEFISKSKFDCKNIELHN